MKWKRSGKVCALPIPLPWRLRQGLGYGNCSQTGFEPEYAWSQVRLLPGPQVKDLLTVSFVRRSYLSGRLITRKVIDRYPSTSMRSTRRLPTNWWTCCGSTLAPEISPLVTGAAVWKYTYPGLAAIISCANFEGVAVLLAIDRGGIRHNWQYFRRSRFRCLDLYRCAGCQCHQNYCECKDPFHFFLLSVVSIF
jgi:hypothetical protein